MNFAEKIYTNPDIYRIKVVLPDNPLKYLNSYILEDKGEWLIIDTGFNRPECREALSRGLEELNIDWTKAKLFLSHLHSDHTGLVDYFVKKQVPIFMGAADCDYLHRYINKQTWQKIEAVFDAYGFPPEEMAKQMHANHARGFAPKEGFASNFVDDGFVLKVGERELRCVFMPGHTPGQFCLYMPKEKIFFSADHVLFDITPNISVWLDAKASLQDYLESLDKVKELDIELTLPGHREFKGNIYERVVALKEHHRLRLAEIADTVAQNPGCTVYEVAGRITWSARGRSWEEFPPNQRWFAMGETLSHVVWLGQQGYIRKNEQNRLWITSRYEGIESLNMKDTVKPEAWL